MRGGARPDNLRHLSTTVALLIVSYLLLVLLLPLAISALAGYRGLPRGRACPQCAGATEPLLGRWRGRPRALARRAGVQRRWCLTCGWQGLVRAGPPAAPEPVRPSPGREAVLALDVRSLRVDGRLWRVQLQSWRDPQSCHGRLVFIEPSGRLLHDRVEAFSGATQFEVLGQALSIPDRLLAGRVRRLLTSDR